MQLLNKAANFTSAKGDLKKIYLTFVRSILEQSPDVWLSSLSKTNHRNLERVQKATVRLIMGQTYTGYENGLKALNIETLDKRRDRLCLMFAKNCLKSEKLRNLFERNNPTHKMKKRNKPKSFKCKKIRTERYKKSSIPFMTNLLNNESEEKSLQIKEIGT